MNYYDLVLMLVPFSFIGATGIVYATGTSVEVSLMIGGAICVAIIGHAMFANPPVDKLPDIDMNETTEKSNTKKIVSND